MKNYRRHGQPVTDPQLLFEVRLDLHDVRSGYNETCQLLLAGPALDEAELEWTPDMVQELTWDELEEIEPPYAFSPPAGSRDRVVAYLLRHYRVDAWTNPRLRLYSEPGEGEADFRQRCQEEATRESARDLQHVKDIYLHRFLEMEQRALVELENQDWDREVLDQRVVAARTAFTRIREDLEEWFSHRGLTELDIAGIEWAEGVPVATRERLNDLKADFAKRYEELHAEILRASSQIEPYRVPASYSQVGVASQAVLWV